MARTNEIPRKLGVLLAGTLAAANVLGRVQIVQHVHQKTGKRVPVATSSRKSLFSDDSLNAGFALDLPDSDAAAYIRALTPVTKGVYDGLTAQYRQDAFTIAGTSDLKLIAKIRDALANAAETGQSSEQFEAAARQLTSEAGVEQLNAFTLDTAFQTAMQKAYSLGRYEQMIEPTTNSILPFWQYWTVGDDHVRPEHAAFHKFTALADDPVWRKLYPPNGFNCRCSVVPILASEAPADASEGGVLRAMGPRFLVAYLKIEATNFGKVFS